MELKKFINDFAAQFDDIDSEELVSETNFKNLDEWSSLMVLSTIAMIDQEYDVRIKGEDIRNISTIEELFELVKSRLA